MLHHLPWFPPFLLTMGRGSSWAQPIPDPSLILTTPQIPPPNAANLSQPSFPCFAGSRSHAASLPPTPTPQNGLDFTHPLPQGLPWSSPRGSSSHKPTVPRSLSSPSFTQNTSKARVPPQQSQDQVSDAPMGAGPAGSTTAPRQASGLAAPKAAQALRHSSKRQQTAILAK